ncbi:frataxin, mitochondrial [Senna tora]|uniref:ferroxidase n=1 Tax=Senna tora TaxID=362788 RepID=A0A834W1J2_9FABA|nr:frataxin, mitochondrial [Senna tora]
MASKLLLLRRLSRFLKPSPASPYLHSSYSFIHGFRFFPLKASVIPDLLENLHPPSPSSSSRSFCSPSFNLNGESQGPTAIDYRSLLQEDEFHRLADSTIHDLQEKFEDYGDTVEVDGFDIDYGNDVLTIKLGDLGTYVLNKQTPNRQIWLSSPVSGPSRFDWDQDAKSWIYRRNKANLYKVLEVELEQLCGKPIVLS